MPTDALGALIEPGDLGVYATGGRAWSREIVQVVEVRKKVKVFTNKTNPPVDINPETINPYNMKWIDPKSMYVVEKFKEK